MKVEKKTGSSFYILGYLLELIIKSGDLETFFFFFFFKIWQIWVFFFFFFKIWQIWVIFFSWKILLYRSKSYLSGQNLAKFHKKEEEALKSGGRASAAATDSD